MAEETKVPTFGEFLNEGALMLGDIKVERMDKGWKLSTPSAMGRGMQVVVVHDDYVPELIKQLSK